MPTVVLREDIDKNLDHDVPQIVWGEEFERFDAMQKEVYLKRLTSSINWALKDMQEERNKALEEIQRLKEQIQNLEANLGTQKTVVHTTIIERNNLEQKYLGRIASLEAKLRELKQ